MSREYMSVHIFTCQYCVFYCVLLSSHRKFRTPLSVKWSKVRSEVSSTQPLYQPPLHQLHLPSQLQAKSKGMGSAYVNNNVMSIKTAKTLNLYHFLRACSSSTCVVLRIYLNLSLILLF